jgi:hypothetical protein
MASYSGLNAKDRALARRLLLKAVGVMMDHPAQIHYTQEAVARWEGIRERIVPWTATGKLNGRYPKHGDCSSTCTWLLWLALAHHFHLPDHVNGEGWAAGYTGTLIGHGKEVSLRDGLPGDLVLYGTSRSNTEHVAMKIGHNRVFSHGSEGGPYILPYNYRSDVICARRYI